jgi:dihydropteroate synthase
VLVSINRKNFLREVAGRDTEAALPVSLAATAMAVERGAHVIRTHDVAETRDAALIGRAFARSRARADDLGVEELDVTTPREAERHLERVGAPAEAAPDAAVHTVELRGLDAGDAAELGTLAGAAGATLAQGESGVLLIGSTRALRAMAEDPPAGLATTLAAVREAVE